MLWKNERQIYHITLNKGHEKSNTKRKMETSCSYPNTSKSDEKENERILSKSD